MNSVTRFKDYTDSAISVLDLINTPEKAERNKAHIYNVSVNAHDLITGFVAWHPSSDIEGDMLENKMSRETIMRALAQKRRYGAGDYLTPIDGDMYDKDKNTALYQALCAILDEYNSIKQHRSHIDADTLMMRLGYLANMVNKKIGEVSELLGKPDYSHMNSYSMTVEFSMMELYDFLIREKVISKIDCRQFSDSIEHAHINELWENAYVIKYRKRNILQCVFKMLAQECYPAEWLEQCAKNLGMKKKLISNPTKSGKTAEFEDKLRAVLKGKPTK